MSRGTPALIGWLGLAVLALCVIATIGTLLLSQRPQPGIGHPFKQLLFTFEHALDPGTIAGDDPSEELYLTVMLLVTISGIFIVSALIGVIATGLDTQITNLRKGRSFVVETHHTLVLGWSDTVFTILAELAV